MSTPSPDPVVQYFNIIGRYPANNQQWWLARSDLDDATRDLKAGDFMPELLQKMYMGDMHAPRGHYILNAFYKDRTTISGVPSIAVESIAERPSSVSFFSGRVWYACNSVVYFSQILQKKEQAGKCHMDADPTSETISDPVATDGGVIPIPEASKIIRLVPYAGGILVFSYNGTWFITGTASGFTALDISVNKISPIGCRSASSVVVTDNAVMWWSDIGIMGVTEKGQGQLSAVTSHLNSLNISEPVIHSFYNSISDAVRAEVIGAYDGKANVVYWLYRSEDMPARQFDRILALDLGLDAFYPWKFSSITDGPVIKGMFVGTKDSSYTVPTDIRPTQIKYLTMTGGIDASQAALSISQVRSGLFVDWHGYDAVGVPYDSYMETGYELFDDSMRRKNITYLFTYLTRTETSADEDGIADYPSACDLTVKWDWSSSSFSNKWTDAVSVYRNNRLLFDSPDTGFGMVISKNKIRGNGKAIQFRYGTSEPGKNFDLNGWAVEVSGDPVP
jgi:hypothetical protein